MLTFQLVLNGVKLSLGRVNLAKCKLICFFSAIYYRYICSIEHLRWEAFWKTINSFKNYYYMIPGGLEELTYLLKYAISFFGALQITILENLVELLWLLLLLLNSSNNRFM